MIKRPLLILVALGALCAFAWYRHEPVVTLRIESKAFRRSGCGWSPPYRLDVRTKGGTPVSGSELTLELTAYNAAAAGPFECWIHHQPGAIEPLDGQLRWTRSLAIGGVETWSTRVRVLSNQPIDLTGKMRSLEGDRATQPSAETYLKLFPFEVRGGKVTAQWDQQTLRPLSEPRKPTVKLPNGDVGVIYAEVR